PRRAVHHHQLVEPVDQRIGRRHRRAAKGHLVEPPIASQMYFHVQPLSRLMSRIFSVRSARVMGGSWRAWWLAFPLRLRGVAMLVPAAATTADGVWREVYRHPRSATNARRAGGSGGATVSSINRRLGRRRETLRSPAGTVHMADCVRAPGTG